MLDGSVNRHPKTRLGRLLVDAGVLDQATLDRVLSEQPSDGRRLGDILVARGIVNPARLAQILSHQLACPWVSPAGMALAPSLLALVPRAIAIEHRLVPVYLRAGAKRALFVAMDDPTNDAALAAVGSAAKFPAKPMVAVSSDLREALVRHYDAPRDAPPSARPPALLENDHLALSDDDLVAHDAPPLPPLTRRPVVLVVNAPPRFELACREAALAVGAAVETAALATAADLASAHALLAIAVTDDVYAFDRRGLSALAIESDALLVVWSDDLEAAQLEPLLRSALARRR